MEHSSNTVGQSFPQGGGEVIQALSVTDDRKRMELDGLLRMAEELQEGLENAGQRFLTNSLFLSAMLVAGLGGFLATVFLIKDFQYKVVGGGFSAVFLIVTVLILARNQVKFQVHQRRDKNALNEVLKILQEVEPILRTTSDWSRLDEAAFRIRLSRFGVGRSSNSISTPVDREMDRFTRTMRFLLEESNANYRKFVEAIFGNIDVAVNNLMEALDFDEVMRRAGARLEIVDDQADFDKIAKDANYVTKFAPSGPTQAQTNQLVTAHWGGSLRNYAVFGGGRVVMNLTAKRDFDARQQQLRIQLR